MAEAAGADTTGCWNATQLDSKSVLEIYGTWQAPDDEKARKRYHASHLQHETFDPATAKVADFKEFGAGHLLYFFWLRYMAVVFLVLALVPAVPLMVFYLGGQFLTSSSTDLEASTIGNFGLPSSDADTASLPIVLTAANRGADAELAIVAYMQSQAALPAAIMSSIKANKLSALVSGTALDLVGMVFFLGACILLKYKTRQMSDKVGQQVTSLPDYSIEVIGLPHDTSPDELKKYCEQWGEVAQVECARKCDTLIRLVLDRRKVLDELDMATAVLQRSAALTPQVDEKLELDVLDAQYDLSLMTEAVKACQRAQGNGDVVRGYVTFSDSRSRDAALAALPRTWLARLRQPVDQRFRGTHRLRVGIAPQATDIYFENLEFSGWYRFGARTGTFLLKALLVFAGFVLVSMAPSIKRNVTGDSGPSTDECDLNCSWKDSKGQLYLNETMRDVYKGCHDTGTYSNKVSCQGAVICYECFCRAALSVSMYTEASYCSEYSSLLVKAAGAQALTVVTIVAVNFAVKKMIQSISRWEKHRTRTREGLSMLSALFTTMFINTAFSIVIANMYLPSVQGSLPGVWQRVLFGGIYSDTSPNWYREVGKALLVSQIISIPVRAAVIGSDILLVKWRWSRRGKALTQSQLEQCYQGHEFELSERYGELLAVIFACLVFSAAMPLMYWVLAISFLVHYNLERYELLRICRWPVSYSSHLGKRVANVLPWAVVWHLMGAVWMVSVVGAPSSPLFGTSFAYDIVASLCESLRRLWAQTTQLPPTVMAARLTNNAVGHLLWAFVLITLAMLLWLAMPAIKAAWRYLRRVSASHAHTDKTAKDMKQAEDDPTQSAEFLVGAAPPSTETEEPLVLSVPEFPLAVRSKLLVGPQTYEMRTNPNYTHAFERLEDFKIKDSVVARVEQRERERNLLPSLRAERRRQRRMEAREALLQGGALLEAHGDKAPEGQFLERLRTQESAAHHATHSSHRQGSGNQVWPAPGDEPGMAGAPPWAGAGGSMGQEGPGIRSQASLGQGAYNEGMQGGADRPSGRVSAGRVSGGVQGQGQQGANNSQYAHLALPEHAYEGPARTRRSVIY